MIRKVVLVLIVLGLGVIAVLASGTYFAAREARSLVKAEVDKAREAKCKSERADFQNAWNRAVDSGRFEQYEERLTAMEQRLKDECGKV